MKRIHLLRVEASPSAFATLFAAAGARGERIGWLELESAPELPEGLGEAVDLGARPAAAVAGGRALTVRRLQGPPVLRDVLRRDFLGCRAVLVRGAVAAPLLVPEATGWRVTPPGEEGGSLSSDGLLDALRRPRPWGGSAGRDAAPPGRLD